MQAQVLVVEDDTELGTQIVRHLEGAGFSCIWWREGHTISPDAPPDVGLVVLDLMMPRVSGRVMLEQLRAACDVPVLVLSARNETSEKVAMLKLGADDYMTKPFWPEELVERVKARIRRPVLARNAVLEIGVLRIDTSSRKLWCRGQSVEVTRVEYDLLMALAKRPGTAISRRWLAENILDPDREIVDRGLDVHISRLRKKLGSDVIETIWGIGYRLAVISA